MRIVQRVVFQGIIISIILTIILGLTNDLRAQETYTQGLNIVYIENTIKFTESEKETLKSELKSQHGSDFDFRISKGIDQVAALWRAEDGSVKEMQAYCKANFIADFVHLCSCLKK